MDALMVKEDGMLYVIRVILVMEMEMEMLQSWFQEYEDQYLVKMQKVED